MEIAIYGAGGFGREVKCLVEDIARASGQASLRCFVDDNAASKPAAVQGVPVFGLEDARQRYPEARMVIAVGYTRLRASLAKKAADVGWRFATLVHPSVIAGYGVAIGEGSIVTARNVLTTDIVVGKHVILNLACTVGHDTVIEDFVTLAPGCHIAGCVRIRQYCFFGQGVVTMQGTLAEPVIIGENTTAGLNAAVTQSVDTRSVITAPAAEIRQKKAQ